MQEFGVADGKLKWKKSLRAPLRFITFTRNSLIQLRTSTRTCLYSNYCNHKNVYSIKFVNYIVNFYTWRFSDISIQ